MRRLFAFLLLLPPIACSDPEGSDADADAGDDGDDDGDDDGEPVQPGLDDPTARQWEKAETWYPEDPVELDEAVGELIDAEAATPRATAAIVVPHASLKFSGPTAAKVWAQVEPPDVALILAPDHWGDGEPAAIWTEGPWLVPGHALEIDYDLMEEVRAALPDLQSDRIAFSHHETEMQMPFLQYLDPSVKIVPVALFDNSKNHYKDFDPERVAQWGAALADVLRAQQAQGKNVLVVATVDLVHHEPADLAEVQNAQLMEHIVALDVPGLYDFVTAEEVSICSEINVSIAMATLLELGYDAMELIAIGDSLHANPDENDVIGYAAAAAWKE